LRLVPGQWESAAHTARASWVRRTHCPERLLMARVVWALFCEHQTTDADGRNSYISVFDHMTVGVRVRAEIPLPQEPLSPPVPTGPFVLALHLNTQPGSPEVVVHVMDPDGQRILPEMRSRLARNSVGKHNLHLRFPRGMPVTRSGTYIFRVSVEGEAMRQKEIEFPISVQIEREGGAE
jgi:hypothetical protein